MCEHDWGYVWVCVGVCVDWTQNVYEHFSWPLSVVLCGPRPPIINIIHIYDGDAKELQPEPEREWESGTEPQWKPQWLLLPFPSPPSLSLSLSLVGPRPLRSHPPTFLAKGQTKPRRVASPPGLALLYYCQWFAFGLIKCKQIEFFPDARLPLAPSRSPRLLLFRGARDVCLIILYTLRIRHVVCVCVCGSNNMKLSSMCANKASIHGGKLINLSGQSRYIGQWHWKWARKCFLLFQFLPFWVGPNRIAQGINLFW